MNADENNFRNSFATGKNNRVTTAAWCADTSNNFANVVTSGIGNTTGAYGNNVSNILNTDCVQSRDGGGRRLRSAITTGIDNVTSTKRNDFTNDVDTGIRNSPPTVANNLTQNPPRVSPTGRWSPTTPWASTSRRA